MRKSVAKCSAKILAMTLVGLVIFSAQLLLPARVDSRETPIGLEDGGDPDMPDQVMQMSDRMDGLASATRFATRDAAAAPDGQTRLGTPYRVEPGVFHGRVEYRKLVLRLWFSMTTLVFAF